MPQVATGALAAPKPGIANKELVFIGRGGGDLNARPPVPKASERVKLRPHKIHIINGLVRIIYIQYS